MVVKNGLKAGLCVLLFLSLSACPNPFFQGLMDKVEGAKAGGQVGLPVFTPTTGSYSMDQNVVISTATQDATIYYTTDGTTPTRSSPAYTGPIGVAGNGTTVTISAIASKPPDMTDSAVATAVITINYFRVSTPQLNPMGGTFPSDQNVQITCSTPNSTIHYTTDGVTVPTAASPAYTGPIPVAGDGTSMRIQAVATASQMADSTAVSETYNIAYPHVAVPVLNPPPGTYAGDQEVILVCSTPGATIHYTDDGNPVSSASHAYKSPIYVAGDLTSMTISAMATAPGMIESAISSGTYSIQYSVVSAPQFSPGGGIYSSDLAVQITCPTSPSIVHYTTDGSNWISATPPISIAVSGNGTNMTVQAWAEAAGMTDSGIVSATYSIDYNRVSTPQFNPVGGVFTADTDVTITCSTSGSTIYYTTDGVTTPTTASPSYSGPIHVTGDGTSVIIQAMATAPLMANSTVALEIYSISYPLVAPPTISPAGGRIGYMTQVHITSPGGNSIAYTTDGTAPVVVNGIINQGIAYSGPFTLPYGTSIVNALAYEPGLKNSPVVSRSFDVHAFLYSAEMASSVSSYEIDLGSGSLNQLQSNVSLADTPSFATVDPQGAYIYFIYFSYPMLSWAPIQPASQTNNGQLGTVSTLPSLAFNPVSMAVDPSGQYMYIADSGSIYVFTVGAGTPSDTGFAPITCGSIASMAVDPAGLYLYVSSGGNSVISYSIDGGNHSLTGIPSSLTVANAGVFAFQPSGNNLYVAAGTDIQAVSISAGILAGNGTAAVGTGITDLAIDPSGRYLFEADTDGSVYSFAIDSIYGMLSPTSYSQPIGSPHSLTVDPTGQYLYVANSIGFAVFQIGADGSMTPIPGSPFSFTPPNKLVSTGTAQ